MKKRGILAMGMMLMASLLMTGCYGKFAMTKKLYQVNSEVKDKYLRSGVTWAFVPVYGLTGLLDFVVFNTIEFWSGQNPVVAGEKTMHFADQTGSYEIKASKADSKVLYDINRTGFDGKKENIKVDWNLKDQSSVVKVISDGSTSAWLATKSGGDVKVTALTGNDPALMASSK